MRKAMLPVVLLASLAVAQQPGSLDLSFNPDDVGYGTGDGAYLQVYASASQPDGRVIVGGAFLDMNGHFRRHLARFETDGMLDMAFMPIFNGAVRTILVQPDGRIVVGGEFHDVQRDAGTPPRAARADGTTDITFATPGAPSPVHAIARQSNGSLVVAGMFQSWGGEPRPGIVRLLERRPRPQFVPEHRAVRFFRRAGHPTGPTHSGRRSVQPSWQHAYRPRTLHLDRLVGPDLHSGDGCCSGSRETGATSRRAYPGERFVLEHQWYSRW